MRRTFGSVERYGERYGIEVTRDRRAGNRYEVIEYNVPGATSYGCKNLDEVMTAINEILYEQGKRKQKAEAEAKAKTDNQSEFDKLVHFQITTDHGVINVETTSQVAADLVKVVQAELDRIGTLYWADVRKVWGQPDKYVILWKNQGGILYYWNEPTRTWIRCSGQAEISSMDRLYAKLSKQEAGHNFGITKELL